MINLPTTIKRLNELIKNNVQEDVHLDYKESLAIDRSKRVEISKDVSAFANSDGGVLIYGIVEVNHLPERLDAGVDDTQYNREWLEQVISSNVNPRISDLRIVPIRVSAGRSAYAINIPKSFRGPHQAGDKKYYKRFNFQSVAMEDYEINDVRSRRQVFPPLIKVDAHIKHGILVYIDVSNIGAVPAIDVRFSFSPQLNWRDRSDDPVLFRRGIKSFAPGKTYSYFYQTFGDVFNPAKNTQSAFDVSVEYLHPELNERTTEVFHIDLRDYDEATVVESEIYELSDTIAQNLKKITDGIQRLNTNVESLTRIAGGSGLDLSVSTIKNLRNVLAGNDRLERIDPTGLSFKVFKEVLGVDRRMAIKLVSFFRTLNSEKDLMKVEGMTEELAKKLKASFEFE